MKVLRADWLFALAVPEPFFDRLLHEILDPRVLVALGVGSLVLFMLGLAGVPWFLTRLPADYFSSKERSELGLVGRRRGPVALALKLLKNVLGAFLLVAGFAMLFLPGQGVLTLIVGLGLLDFPGKKQLQRRLIASGPVLRAVNALRERAGCPPLEMEPRSASRP